MSMTDKPPFSINSLGEVEVTAVCGTTIAFTMTSDELRTSAYFFEKWADELDGIIPTPQGRDERLATRRGLH